MTTSGFPCRFTPQDGVSLEMVGIFDGLGDGLRRVPDVQGWADTDKITLSECRVGGEQRPALLIGHHLPSADQSFQTARLQLAHMNEWIRRAGWTVDDPDTTFTVNAPTT